MEKVYYKVRIKSGSLYQKGKKYTIGDTIELNQYDFKKHKDRIELIRDEKPPINEPIIETPEKAVEQIVIVEEKADPQKETAKSSDNTKKKVSKNNKIKGKLK